MKMIRNEIVRLFVAVLFVVGKASCQLDHSNLTTKPAVTEEYFLGSESSKAYYFPWMVSIHREYTKRSEIFGTGSILTRNYVLASMDSFVRKSRLAPRKLFFQEIKFVTIYSSGIWGEPYLGENTRGPDWLEKRRIVMVYIWSDPERSIAKPLAFSDRSQPYFINELKRSPFGFSMSIALIRIQRDIIQYPYKGIEGWIWDRITLPIPLFANRAQQVRIRLESEIERFEKAPYSNQCYLGGWRLQDRRLIQHLVVYVPLEQCQAVYCDFDQRACGKWPVKGVHACFKSLSFQNACWTDQGSALYCRHISDSVIAILTSAPTCGVFGLPAVFTLVHYGLELLETVGSDDAPDDSYTAVPHESLYKYTPPPVKDLVAADV